MDLQDFEGQDMYFNSALPPRVAELIEQAAALYGEGDAEKPLLRAFFLTPENLMVHVALYRFYYYQHRYSDALFIADKALAVTGRELGLPESFIRRHPFPGPGLAIRCPGEITREKLDILRQADAVYLDQIHKHGLYDDIWQAFVAILPVKTVGVMGDYRTYDFACSLRAVTSVDGMTADYYPFTHEFLGETATRIINEVQGINRVMYDITSKPPGTIEME